MTSTQFNLSDVSVSSKTSLTRNIKFGLFLALAPPSLTCMFLYMGTVGLESKANFLIWQWYDYAFYGHSNVLLFWASVESYLFLPFLAIVVYLTLFLHRSNFPQCM